MAADCVLLSRSWLIVIKIIILSYGALGRTLVYRTIEERPQGTFIGSVPRDSNLQSQMTLTEFRQLRYSFLTQDKPHSHFFRIRGDTGQIYTVTAIDRELVCDSEATECSADLAVAALSTGGEFFQVFPVKVIIEDINDNSPHFPRNSIYLQIPESVDVGSTYIIQGAKDSDAGNNSVQAYGLYPPDGVFGLKTVQNLEGAMDVGIVVREQLDRERTFSYKLTIYAKDGGHPVRSGSVVVNITITDENDHYPEFSSNLYNFSLVESTPVGTTVLHLKARDLDSGKNGEVVYHFSRRSPKSALEKFELNSSTGAVTLKSQLDFESAHRYQFAVEASDHGGQPRTSQAVVIVNVLDVNDETPIIKFDLLAAGDYAELPENAAKGKFIAHMSVTDRDSGQNGAVVCQLGTNKFRLQRLFDKAFKIILNSRLDREDQEVYKIKVLCQDGGYPALRGSATLTLRIRDVNDNPPVFSQSVYTASILENQHSGLSVIQVLATDTDGGKNGEVFYEMHGKHSRNFTIGRDNGVIRTAGLIDRENTSDIQLVVIARDNGSPTQLYAQANVIITVLDVNDETPKFNRSEYNFRVPEYKQPNITVGSVLAIDQDLGSGGQVVYSIVASSDPSRQFTISPKGDIRANKILDREVQSTYTFVVMATDKGKTPYSSTVTVIVQVTDLNDHSPQVMNLKAENGTLDILHTSPVNYKITTIISQDLDEGRNSEFSYYIERGNKLRIFKLDGSSGELRVARRIDKSEANTAYNLLISVKDHGEPQRTTLKNIIVVIALSNSTSEFLREPAQRGANFIIIISVVIATVIASVIIVMAICCVRRRDARRRRPPNYFIKPEEQNIVKNKDLDNSSVEASPKIIPPQNENDLSMDTNKRNRKEVSFSLEENNADQNASFSTFKGQKGNPGKTLEPPFPYMDMMWPYKEDNHSNTSGETFTSDSGRGGSDDDLHNCRRQQHSITTSGSPRMVVVRVNSGPLVDTTLFSPKHSYVPNIQERNAHIMDQAALLETDLMSEYDVMDMLMMQDALLYGRNGVLNNSKVPNTRRDYVPMHILKKEMLLDRMAHNRVEPVSHSSENSGDSGIDLNSRLRNGSNSYSSLDRHAGGGCSSLDRHTPVPKIRDSACYFDKNFPDLLKHNPNSINSSNSSNNCVGLAGDHARIDPSLHVHDRTSVSTACSSTGCGREDDGETTTSGSYCVSPVNFSEDAVTAEHGFLKDAFV